MPFDIEVEAQNIAAENDGRILPIIDADGEPALQDDGSPVTWTVCGVNSAQYRKAETWQRKALRAFTGREMTDDEYNGHRAEFIARCSLGCAGFASGGQALPFSTANATRILARLPHIRRQIEAAMGDHAGFKKASAN